MAAKMIIILALVCSVVASSYGQDTLTILQIRQNPQEGQTVVTGGVITAAPAVFNHYFFDGRFYVADPNGGPYSGIMAYPGPQGLSEGDSILFTATVRSIYGSASLQLSNGTLQDRGSLPVPDPVVVTASVIDTLGVPDSIFQQYRGVLIRIEDITFDQNNQAYEWIWQCHDNVADFNIWNQTNFIPRFFIPNEETNFSSITGLVERANYYLNGIFLQPRFLSDFNPLAGPPLISRVERFPRLPASGDAVTAKAIILDDGTIAQASLFYRIDQGAWNEIIADNTDGVYSAVIPAQPDSTHVDYYYRAQDNEGNLSFEPAGAPDSFYSYEVGWRELCHYVPGDINGDGRCDGMDVVFAVIYFVGRPGPPPYPCDCVDNTPFYPAGDANGSCSFNGLDVTYMVAYFKGGPDIHYCQSCPPAP